MSGDVFADIARLERQQIWEGVVGRIVHGQRVTLSVVELEANCVVPAHSHENEQVGMIVLGSLTFRVGDETRELQPGGTWRIPANVPHEVRTGADGAVVLEVFAPPRQDWEALERHRPCPPRWPA
jgi:quercetin dioxygenase-like cupin family protein